jgi:protein-S-isoprenylcysteine O-methyltransferase Ste14
MNSGWRWGNAPLPESHLLLIIIGVGLGAVWPLEVGLDTTWLNVLGLVMTILGVGVAVWATHTAGRVNLADPDRLVADGPYAKSRHPMYGAWTLIYVGFALVLDSGWLLMLVPILLIWIHWETGREEKQLMEHFGSEYEEYRARVRRYI